MLNISFRRSFNLLRMSTWFTAILSLLLLSIVAFFVLFPQTMKGPLEQRLSGATGLDVSIERLALEFIDNDLLLAVHGVKIGAKGLNPIVSMDVLRWDVNPSALIGSIEIPGHIDINELSIDATLIESYMAFIDTDAIFSNNGLSSLLALETLSINKTIILGENAHHLAPIELKRNKQKITFSMENQALMSSFQAPIIGNTVDIKTSIDVERARANRVAIFPFNIKNKDFNLSAQLKVFSQQDKVFLELQSYVDQIDVAKIHQNLPEPLADTKSAIWLNNALGSGVLKDVLFTTRFTLSGDDALPVTKLSANLENVKLTMNSKWAPITGLNARVTFTNDHVKITGKDAKLDTLDLSYINIDASNLGSPDAQLVIHGRVKSSSEEIVDFMRRSPVSDRIKSFLDQFKLKGDIGGNVVIVVPFSEQGEKKKSVEFDLFVNDNKLTLFEEKISIEKFTSKISYHDNTFKTDGKGVIGGVPFELLINPDKWIDTDDSSFKVAMKQTEGDINAYISKGTGSEWQAQIESKNLQVGIYLSPRPNGVSFVELHNLKLSTLEKTKLPWRLSPEDFPSFRLISKNAEINDISIPNFEADLVSKDQVLQIKNLKFEGVGLTEKELIFNGDWLGGKTTLRTKASHHNLSDFLHKFDIQEPVIGGAFAADIRLYCDCAPWEVSIPQVSGLITVDIEEGVFTNQDQNFFRLLSFINLEFIADRIRKPNSAVREQGFVYDRIHTALLIGNGKASIKDFLLESDESNIELTGYLGLAEQDYHLKAKVQPFLADSVPLAAYMAGGGLYGFAVWVVDKLLLGGEVTDVINKVLEFNYTVTGPWSEPVIQSQVSGETL